MPRIADKRNRTKQSSRGSGARVTKRRRLANATGRNIQRTAKPFPAASLQSPAKGFAQKSVENLSENPLGRLSEDFSESTRERASQGVAMVPPEPPEGLPTDLSTQNRHMAQERSATDAEARPCVGVISAAALAVDPQQQRMYPFFRALADAAAQGKVPFFAVCYLGQTLDTAFATVGRPKRWNLLPHEKKLHESTLAREDDFVQLDASASQRLQEFCEAAAKRSRDHTLTIEVLEDFVDVLRDAMKPLVESYLSGTLKLGGSEEEMVHLIRSEDQALLARLLRVTIFLTKKNALTAGVAYDIALLCHAMVLRTVNPNSEVVRRDLLVARDAAIDLDEDTLETVIGLLESCAGLAEAGELEITALWTLGQRLDALIARTCRDATRKWLDSSYTFQLFVYSVATIVYKIVRVSTWLERITNNITVHHNFMARSLRL